LKKKQVLFLLMLGSMFIFGCFKKNKGNPQLKKKFNSYLEEASGIVGKMSMPQKIGQMVLPTYRFLLFTSGSQEAANKLIHDNYIGGVLLDGDGTYDSDAIHGFKYSTYNTTAQYKQLGDELQSAYNGPAQTQLLLATDSVHGQILYYFHKILEWEPHMI